MIVVTLKGYQSPLISKVKGIGLFSDGPYPSAPATVLAAIDRFPRESEFLFVAPGARVHTARIWPLFRRNDFDVAAFVERIGRAPATPRHFDGIGYVSVHTLAFRRTVAALRVLNRWLERNSIIAERENVNLAIALAEVTDSRFLFLPRSWVWREVEMRPLDPLTEPVVEFGSEAVPLKPQTPKPEKKPEPPRPESPKPKAVEAPRLEPSRPEPVKPPPTPPPPPVHKPRGPELLWNGHLYSYASYGKINREILLRVANSITVRIDGTNREQVLVDEYTRARLDPYQGTLIGPRAPFLRFFGPDFRPPVGRHRINWTLMETAGRVHADMASKVNESYDELWSCTEWNAETFRAGGVRVPIKVMPLGVDRSIYRRQRRGKLPACRLISTSKRGLVASPAGFVFLTVGLPSARKGFEVIADALGLAFGPRADVDLVVATTHGPTSWTAALQAHVAKLRNRIWILEGKYNEHEMARLYAASDAYVSASIGEGWNLPAHEASACGRPVIVPRNSVHPEIFGNGAFAFETDGVGRIPAVEAVSPWYVGMEFSILGGKARRALAEKMKFVQTGAPEVRRRVALLDERLVGLTWDSAAANVVRRLMEVQP